MKIDELMKRDGFVILDGAMGTMLQKSGLKLGERPEKFNITNKEIISEIHSLYEKSGSEIIYTNTFGANRHKLEDTDLNLENVISNAVLAARNGSQSACIALDVGPIGELLEPNGSLLFEEAYDIFKEEMIIGQESGADLIVIETMTDLYELKAAILAAKENTSLPVFTSMTFEKNGRTFTGCSVESFVATVEGLGVDALGINCSLGPDEIYPIAKKIRELSNIDIIVKANAGLPNLETGGYDLDSDEYCRYIVEIAKLGVKYIGGCCGTSPEYISKIKKALDSIHIEDNNGSYKNGNNEIKNHECSNNENRNCDRKNNENSNNINCNYKEEKINLNNSVSFKRKKKRKSVVCSQSSLVEIDSIKTVGERINPTGKRRFKEALVNEEMDYILTQAIEQVDAGADILDINLGLPEIDEPEMMRKVIKAIQSITDIPLQIDSSNYDALEAGLRVYNGKPILNSVNGEQKSMDNILPLVKKYGAGVVALTLDERGIPKTAEERFEIAQKIYKECQKYGIKKEDIYVDCLVLTVSAQQDAAKETLKAIKLVKENLGLKTILGVSNISFGLPNRELINSTFLTVAMNNGLDLAIINPASEQVMDNISAFKVLNNIDKDSELYIEKFSDFIEADKKTNDKNLFYKKRNKIIEDKRELSIEEAVEKGLKDETREITEELLDVYSELEIINDRLIPTLDRVGDRYEKGDIFLPQLIKSAEASQEAFEVIKEKIASQGGDSVSKGNIVMATVKGDIHDIGKNIVKVILENYGYNVIDLGRDVDIEKVVDTVVKYDIKLLGLSALMTTTLKSMEKTIERVRKSAPACKIMVGGAVLTEEYAFKIDADYYCKDAKKSVECAKIVFG
ncbi:MAG: homocysteine S-methyltransferase family protein [Peptostreptococcus sp.]|uniref:homocysteine S-methyltransferase family protein n=1 Tax=Peptostreptococcus sp. TaxID=1262 RepID=UPI002FC71548